MLALDLDGTLLNRAGAIEERDAAAVRALQRAGVHVTIATGRLFSGTQWVAEQLGIDGLVAVMNGSELIDAQSGDTLRGHYVDPEVRAEVKAAFGRAGLGSAFLFGSRCIHIGRHDAHNADYLGTWSRDLAMHEDLFGTHAWSASTDVVAIATMGEPEAVEQAREALHRSVPEEIGSVVFPTYAGDTFLKLRHAVENKGTAVARMAEQRGFTAEACVAVGDWMNDIPMLQTAGLSFAMGDTVDAVNDSATEVLASSRGEGGAVAEVARKVWGITADSRPFGS